MAVTLVPTSGSLELKEPIEMKKEAFREILLQRSPEKVEKCLQARNLSEGSQSLRWGVFGEPIQREY